MPATRILALALALAVCGCSGSADPGAGGVTATPPSATGPSATGPTASKPPTSPSPGPTGESRAVFDQEAAASQVRILASDIGPRQATTAAFEQAATLVAGTFEEYGFRVRRQSFRVPAGTSWGVSVPAGSTQNVIALPPGFRYDVPFRIVGAHLDTVPQAPGAEDNASGVAVLLELARMASTYAPAVPVVFVAFGAEEPRGPGDDDHHYGSRHLVDSLTDAQRSRLLGMVSMDRVGVRTAAVPVCFGGRGSSAVQDELVTAAGSAKVRVERCENRASDHWPFEKVGIPAARVGGVPYPAYHSARDVPAVVDPGQLRRVGRLVWTWIHPAEG